MTTVGAAVAADLLGEHRVADGAFVGGAWHRCGGPALPVRDPSTGTVVCEVAEAGDADVDGAVESARQAFAGGWGSMRGHERARILMAVSGEVRRNADRLARLETVNCGKPLSQSRGDVETAASYFEFYAGVADKIHGETVPGRGRYWSYTSREPYGPVAVVTPWNSPISQMCRSVAPCLAAGNCAVVKPSELTPLTSLVLARLFVGAGLPGGVCNVVVGRGATTGEALIGHPAIRHVGFTGSVPTGRRVLELAARRIVGANLELGGKSPSIVMPDADLERAVAAGAAAVVRNAGQSCFATTRLLVHRSILDRFTGRLCQAVGALTVGPGLDDLDVGPLVSGAQLARVEGFLARAREQGATVLVGGDRVPSTGYFLRPAVLGAVRPEMEVAREEVFGPVQCVMGFDAVDDAVAMANDSAYGLAAGVFTRDVGLAHHLARRLEAGQVHVNGYPLGGVETPFGGYKQSGMGREKGLAALDSYLQLKTVIVSDEEA